MDPVIIKQAEYDDIKRDIATLLELHGLVRRMGAIVMGEQVDTQELIEVRQTYQHFMARHRALGEG